MRNLSLITIIKIFPSSIDYFITNKSAIINENKVVAGYNTIEIIILIIIT